MHVLTYEVYLFYLYLCILSSQNDHKGADKVESDEACIHHMLVYVLVQFILLDKTFTQKKN